MGKKSRKGHPTPGAAAAAPSPVAAATAAASSSGGATSAAAVMAAAAFDAQSLLGSEADITVRLGELLDSIRCRNVLQRLRTAGYSDHVAQRACLEVHQAKREVNYESAVKWIRRHDITIIDCPLQPLELLRYLSDIVVSLVERLPKPDTAQLHRTLAADLHAPHSNGASSSTHAAAAALLLGGGSVSSVGARGSGASGAGNQGSAGSTASTAAMAQSVLARLDSTISAAVAAHTSGGGGSGGSGGAGLAGHPTQLAGAERQQEWQWQAALDAEDEVLAKLAAAGASGGDLQAMLRELGAVDDLDCGGSAGSGGSTPSSKEAGASGKEEAGAGGGGRGSGDSDGDGDVADGSCAGGVAGSSQPTKPAAAASLSPGAKGKAAAHAALAKNRQERLQEAQLDVAKPTDAVGSAASGSGGSGGFTGRVAQQVLGLQQHMSKAMATLVSMRRSSSSSSNGGGNAADGLPKPAAAGTTNSSGGGHAEDSVPAAAVAAAPAAASFAHSAEEAASEELATDEAQQQQQQLNEGQLASLRAMLGPGVEVYTAEEFQEHNPGADYESLPALDLQLLPPQGPTTPAGSMPPPLPLPEAEGGPAGTEAQPLAAELASLRLHREWADRRIAQLIRRVGEAERPVREEAGRLLREVQALRAEKEGLRGKLKDLELGVARIKESSYAEAQQRRELERQAAVAASELKAASLREQEASTEAAALHKQLAAERKQRLNAEQRCKKAAAEAAAAAAAAAAHEPELEGLRQQLRLQQTAAREQRSSAGRAEASAAEAHTQAAATTWAQCELLAAEKASLVAALELAEQRTQQAQRARQAAEEGRAALAREVEAARQRASAAEAGVQGLRRELAAARAKAAAAEARAASAGAAASAAQQQMGQLLQAQQAQQARGSAGTSPNLQPLLLQPAAAAAASPQPPSLFGPQFHAWTLSGASGSGSGLLASGSLAPPQPCASGFAQAAAGFGAQPGLPSGSSLSMGGSSGPPSSPLSHSGANTPKHSMHSSSIANSPMAPHGAMGPPPGPTLGANFHGSGEGLFAGLPGAPSLQLPAADSLFGNPSILLPDPNSIWGGGLAGGPGAAGLPLFAQQQQQLH